MLPQRRRSGYSDARGQFHDGMEFVAFEPFYPGPSWHEHYWLDEHAAPAGRGAHLFGQLGALGTALVAACLLVLHHYRGSAHRRQARLTR